jgi:predicted nucleic acid-binding protein
MRRVFVDTSAWIALLDDTDSLFEQAHRVSLELRAAKTLLVTTEFVLLELADAFCMPHLRSRAVTYIESLRRETAVITLPASTQWFSLGWEIFKKRSDKSWSLTDCISFAVMSNEGLAEAFTSDRHYEQAGFAKLL